VRKEFKYAKDPNVTELSDHKKQKIKDFVKAYMTKVMARRAQKEATKQQHQGSFPGPSESVSTGTPQLPGSTPRDQFPKDIEQDTPVSTKTLSITGENDQPRPLSPTEFLKGLERELGNNEGELELL
jgi:SRI (Set2 Rpb1 interacting) domain